VNANSGGSRTVLAAAVGVTLLVAALVYGCFGTAPTGMVRLVGDVGNHNDATLARWATAAIPLCGGLIVLGLINTQWVSGTGRRDGNQLEAIDASLLAELSKLVIQLQTFANVARDDLTDLRRRISALEGKTPGASRTSSVARPDPGLRADD
jgi:hypothetical protein